MYTDADQLTSSKRSELLNLIRHKKSFIIAICEIKPKNLSEETEIDYA